MIPTLSSLRPTYRRFALALTVCVSPLWSACAHDISAPSVAEVSGPATAAALCSEHEGIQDAAIFQTRSEVVFGLDGAPSSMHATVHVADIAGAPVAGLAVRGVFPGSNEVHRGTTDESGLVHFSGVPQATEYRPDDFTVLEVTYVAAGEPVTAVLVPWGGFADCLAESGQDPDIAHGAGTSSCEEKDGPGTSSGDSEKGAGTSSCEEKDGPGTSSGDRQEGAGTSSAQDPETDIRNE